MLKSKKYLIAVTLTLGTSLISTSQVFAQSNINISRLAGQDRYGTSNAIVSQGWTQSDYAILVNSQDFPDAITASPLAKKYNAPILLTDSNVLTDSTKQELQNLGVKNVFIIGGSGVVSSDVENTLESMGIIVKRIWGQDRYETSINVAKELGSNNGVFVVNGEHYEDALSVAPIADKLQYPIILVSQDSVPDVVKNYVNGIKNNGGEIDVVGGQDVLTDTATNALNPTKVYNQSTKYDRNLALINDYKGQLDLSKVYLASDKGFADALSGSALAGENGNPIILVGDSNQYNAYSFISSNNVGNVYVLGGTGVLSDDVINKVAGETSTIKHPNGSVYVGEVKDNKEDGLGTITFANGDKYVGEFKDDEISGTGTYTFANGQKYVGESKHNKPDGQGIYTWPDGTKYVGEFTDGKMSTSVILTKTTDTLTVGGTDTLTANVFSSNLPVTWTSSNANVATVDNGVITGINVGNATITATTTDGGTSATCTVAVNASNVQQTTNNTVSGNTANVTPTVPSSSIFFPQLSDVPMPTNVKYYKNLVSPDGTTVFYYYSFLSLPSDFVSNYSSLLANNGWVFYNDSNAGEVCFVKGNDLIMITFTDNDVIIEGTIH